MNRQIVHQVIGLASMAVFVVSVDSGLGIATCIRMSSDE